MTEPVAFKQCISIIMITQVYETAKDLDRIFFYYYFVRIVTLTLFFFLVHIYISVKCLGISKILF